MKKIILSCFALFAFMGTVRADEGMWLLKLMEQQHLEDSLRKAGLQLPVEALYSETGPSIRDCIGIFGGGCTGEVVSPEGLVLTNHHCGFSYVHAMSTLEHNYMKDGYFARSRTEELRSPESLTFTFVRRVENVTEVVTAAAKKKKADEYTVQSQSFLEPIAEKLLKKSDYKKAKGMRVRVVPFFGGNSYYAFYEQEYYDIRLVASPPNNVGQFGGNSDNWMWPRHNADFAMFRIYADKQGNPAAYSPDNVPLKCTKFLPISLKGVNEGDYTMIMGFPGTTTRYLTASQVEVRTGAQNAAFVTMGNPLLKYYKELMDQSDELRLLLEDEYSGWGNVVKNFGGMNEAVRKIGLVAQKQAEERAFRTFAAKSGKAEYANIIDRIDRHCRAAADSVHDFYLSLMPFGEYRHLVDEKTVDAYLAALDKGKQADIAAAAAQLKTMVAAASNPIYTGSIERGKLELLTPIFIKNKRLATLPEFLKGDWKAFYADVTSKSVLNDTTRLAAALAAGKAETFTADPLLRMYKEVKAYFAKIQPVYYFKANKALDKVYVRGLCEMYDWSKAPDANFTQRMTYGKVCDLKPRDAVRYNWHTVLDGMFEKESTTESDYFVNPRLKQLYEARDFGRYARPDGKLPTCFLSNNDITGGNSGSAILNAKGELVGLAFDGNIESLSSDLKFNPALQRCINVDIRFVLFVLDKFGGASYVLDEMELR